MNENYVTPQLEVIEIELEGNMLLTTSGQDDTPQQDDKELEVARRGLFV